LGTRRFEKGIVQVGAVGDAVGGAELFLKPRSERQALENFSGHAIAHLDFGGGYATGGHGVPGAEILQSAHRIGPQLQAGANLLKTRGFFQDVGGPANAGQPQPGGKAGNSAADDEKR